MQTKIEYIIKSSTHDGYWDGAKGDRGKFVMLKLAKGYSEYTQAETTIIEELPAGVYQIKKVYRKTE